MEKIKYYKYTNQNGKEDILLQHEGISILYFYNENTSSFEELVTDQDINDATIFIPITKQEAFQIGYNEQTYKKTKTFIQKAWFLAAFFHFGQKWKDGKDMMKHLQIVASSFKDMAEIVTAILHELLACTDCNSSLIKVIFGERILEAVEALTRKRGEDIVYSYIPRLRKNPLGKKVKIIDIRELMDLNKLEEITQQDIETYHKYKQVGMMLGASFIELVPSSILLEENRYDSLGRILPNRRSKNYSKLTQVERLLLPENPYSRSKNSAYFEFKGKEGYWVTDSAKKELHETIEMKPLKF